MVVEQSQNYSGPLSPSSGKAPHLPWFQGHCPSRSLNFQRSYLPVWVLGWAGQAWVSCGSKGEGASLQAVAGTWLECVINPQILRPLPGTVGAQQHSYVLGECSEFRSTSKCVHPPTQDSKSQDSTRSQSPDSVLLVSGFSSQQTAHQVSLTEATHGAPKTGEAVLHPRGKEGAPVQGALSH